MMARNIEAGASLVLAFDETSFVFVNAITADSKVTTRKKGFFKGSELIGQPYGALFEQVGESLKRIARRKDVTDLLSKAELEHGEDNRDLKMDSAAQQLTHDEIEEMKTNGKSAQEIIEALMANSVTLESKTAFSQEKWLKKKLSKYSTEFQVLFPTSMELSKAFYMKDAHKILSLRWDALAWMLNCADLRSGSHPLVVDGCGGLLIGAVTERLGGEASSITGIYEGGGPPNHYLGFWNFSPLVRSNLKMQRVDNYLKETLPSPQGIYHSFLMAVEHDPLLLVQRLWHMVVPGATCVFYHVYPEAFTGLINWIKKEHTAVEYRINEIFFREYQVLPGRSHPLMQMNNASGFVLTCIKVNPQPSQAPEQVVAAQFRETGASKKGGGKNQKPQQKQEKKKREREEESEAPKKESSE